MTATNKRWRQDAHMPRGRRLVAAIVYGHHCIGSMIVVVWRSGNVVGQINEITLRQARLVLGWVTVYGRVNRPRACNSHRGRLYLPWDGKMSISFRAE